MLGLGHPRAGLLEANPESMRPVAAMNWGRQQLAKLAAALRTPDHPLVTVLDGARAAGPAKTNVLDRPLYLYPLRLSDPQACPEPGRARAGECLAVREFRGESA